MKIKYKSKGIAPIIAAFLALSVFTLSLTLAINSLGSANGQTEAARGTPDSLVSAGAPRSQLELKRMFESMSLTYVENGKRVYEPICAEYRQSYVLSVEEILFIISDSALAFDEYDVIRFRDSSGRVEKEIITFEAEQTEHSPFHISALDRIFSITELVKLRIEYMGGEELSEGDDGVFRYQPRQVERETGGLESNSSFVFENDYRCTISFETGSGSKVALYPSEKESRLCRMKVLLGASGVVGSAERELLGSFGFDTERTRNITPEYWYAMTDFRLFTFGGRVVLTDTAKCTELLPKDHKLTSVALASGGEIYFTSSHGKGSSAWRYSCGELERLFDSDEKYLAAVESANYGSVGIYAATSVEDGRFVLALECIGEPIEFYS